MPHLHVVPLLCFGAEQRENAFRKRKGGRGNIMSKCVTVLKLGIMCHGYKSFVLELDSVAFPLSLQGVASLGGIVPTRVILLKADVIYRRPSFDFLRSTKCTLLGGVWLLSVSLLVEALGVLSWHRSLKVR